MLVLKGCSKVEFENVLFNPNKKLKEVNVKRGLTYITLVYEGIEVIARREITSKGVIYFKA